MSSHNKIFLCFDSINFDPNPSNFDKRKAIQKIIYLLKVFGVKLDIEYNWYLYGPYSPKLTEIIFDVYERGYKIDKNDASLSPKENQILSIVSNQINEQKMNSDDLELVASLLFIINRLKNRKGKDPNNHKYEIAKFLLKQKPRYTLDDVDKAWEQLEIIKKEITN